jgi:hypothetical protein
VSFSPTGGCWCFKKYFSAQCPRTSRIDSAFFSDHFIRHNRMIGYFPQPHSDELWYSICARFSERMRFGTETGTMLALYGRRHAIAAADLPHRLQALASQLPPGHPCTVDAMIDQHTFLPYYSPFLSTSTYATVRQFMTDGSKPSVRVRCGACTDRVRPPEILPKLSCLRS